MGNSTSNQTGGSHNPFLNNLSAKKQIITNEQIENNIRNLFTKNKLSPYTESSLTDTINLDSTIAMKGGNVGSTTSDFNPYTAMNTMKGGNVGSPTSDFNPYTAMKTMKGGNDEELNGGVNTSDIYKLLNETSSDQEMHGGAHDNIFMDTSNDDNFSDSEIDIEEFMQKQAGGNADSTSYNTSDINIVAYESSD